MRVALSLGSSFGPILHAPEFPCSIAYYLTGVHQICWRGFSPDRGKWQAWHPRSKRAERSPWDFHVTQCNTFMVFSSRSSVWKSVAGPVLFFITKPFQHLKIQRVMKRIHCAKSTDFLPKVRKTFGAGGEKVLHFSIRGHTQAHHPWGQCATSRRPAFVEGFCALNTRKVCACSENLMRRTL